MLHSHSWLCSGRDVTTVERPFKTAMPAFVPAFLAWSGLIALRVSLRAYEAAFKRPVEHCFG